MLDVIRLLIALFLFCTGIYGVWDLFTSGFSIKGLGFVILCFVLAHYVAPPRNRLEDALSVLDWIDWIIDIPFKLMAGSIRWLWRLLKGSTDNVDL